LGQSREALMEGASAIGCELFAEALNRISRITMTQMCKKLSSQIFSRSSFHTISIGTASCLGFSAYFTRRRGCGGALGEHAPPAAQKWIFAVIESLFQKSQLAGNFGGARRFFYFFCA
jgi:hypothetical protein